MSSCAWASFSCFFVILVPDGCTGGGISNIDDADPLTADAGGSDAVEPSDDVDDVECDDTDVCCCSPIVDRAALTCDTDDCL